MSAHAQELKAEDRNNMAGGSGLEWDMVTLKKVREVLYNVKSESIATGGTRAAEPAQEEQGFRGQTRRLVELEITSAVPR